MTKLRCCFCQQELETNDLDVQLLGCENQTCKHSIHYDTVGTKELWQELIRTRKALDVAIERLSLIARETFQGEPSSINMGFHVRAEAALADIDEITALEQKDIK